MEQFIARQPIFNRRREVFGYELLFRNSLENYFDFPDQDEAASQVIANSFLLFGIEELTCRTRAFLNVTRKVLVENWLTILPSHCSVIEILEQVEPDPEVLTACKRLKSLGFHIALDDYFLRPGFDALLDLVDIVKVDFLASDSRERRTIAESLLPRGIQMLAEKVETEEDFRQGETLGYSLFQGYFFEKPQILTRRDIPTSKIHFLRLIQEVHQTEMDFQSLSLIIRQEVGIAYKLLKIVNSAAFGMRQKIETIERALAMLGEFEIRKWVSMLALSSMSSDKPAELITCSLIRARTCELLAQPLGLGRRCSDLFLLGLFSLLDAIMDHPLPELLTDIPLAPDVMAALMGEAEGLRPILDLTIGLERGDWAQIDALVSTLGLRSEQLQELNLQAFAWSRDASEI